MSLHFHAHLLQLTETYGHVFQTPDMDLKMFTEKRVIRYKGIDRTRAENNNNKKRTIFDETDTNAWTFRLTHKAITSQQGSSNEYNYFQ